MTLADDVDLEEYIVAKDDLSGADIKVCLFDGLTKVILIVNLATAILLCLGTFRDGFLKVNSCSKVRFSKVTVTKDGGVNRSN